MEQCKGLIAGIDIGYSKIQASVYSYNSRNVQTVKLTEDSKEKTSLVNVVAECMRATGTSQIQSICVTIPDYHSDEISAVRDTLKKCGVSDGRWQVLSRVESFAYYAYSQKKELYQNGTVLMDYNASGIDVYRLYCNKIGDMQYILQEHTLSQPEGSTIEKASHSVTLYMTEYFKKHRASSVYLTGMGFDVDRLPDEFTKVLVAGRKAFVGQNLYVRAACFAALEYIYPQVFGNVCLLTDGRIKADIETDISEHGRPMKFRIVKMGTNWYMAERTIDFIIEDVSVINFQIIWPDGKYIEKQVDISSIPYREGKTTRISMNVKASSQDKCIVTVKDLGFGEIYQASDSVIVEELDLSEADV